jgi:hypothetical protein
MADEPGRAANFFDDPDQVCTIALQSELLQDQFKEIAVINV